MTPTPPRHPPPTAAQQVRRPPRPSADEATVTALGPQLVPRAPVPYSHTQGTLALDLGGGRGVPETPELRAPLNLVSDGDGDEVEMWSARFAQAVVEVIGGDRPLTQLVRWTTRGVYRDLTRRVRIVARTSPSAQRLRTVRPQVRSVHVFRPTQSIAEVSVHVRHGQRSRAIAARLELDDGRWQCTVLHLG